MATEGTWRRRGLAIVAATTAIGSITIWATQVAIATAATAPTVQSSPYFAGAVTTPPLMKRAGGGKGKFYAESGKVSFIVPTVTCPPSQITSYAVIQNLEAAPDETGLAALYLDCGSGTLSADMFTYVEADGLRPLEDVPWSLSFRATRSASPKTIRSLASNGQIPTGIIGVSASTARMENPPGAPALRRLMPDGPVYTGICQRATPHSGRSPECTASPADLGMRIDQSLCLQPLSLSGVKVDNKPIWNWPTTSTTCTGIAKPGRPLNPLSKSKRRGSTMHWTSLSCTVEPSTVDQSQGRRSSTETPFGTGPHDESVPDRRFSETRQR